MNAKNKKIMYWTVAIAAVVGLGWYAHEHNWFGTKDTDTTSKAVSNASGKLVKQKECSDKSQGFHCTGNWARTLTGGCYCANGELKDLNAVTTK